MLGILALSSIMRLSPDRNRKRPALPAASEMYLSQHSVSNRTGKHSQYVEYEPRKSASNSLASQKVIPAFGDASAVP